MIAHATFEPAGQRVRRVRFVRRASVPVDAARLVANGLRETLRDWLGAACEVVLGEPAALEPAAWRELARDAMLYATSGRQTDVVLVLSNTAARRLVLHAFGEDEVEVPGEPDAACTALELRALERIAARCAVHFDALCAERGGAPRFVTLRDVPACAAYFDVRVRGARAFDIGIAVVHELPDPGVTRTGTPHALDALPLRVVGSLDAGRIAAARCARLRPGDLVVLPSSDDAEATLRAGGVAIGAGACGARAGKRAVRLSRDRAAR